MDIVTRDAASRLSRSKHIFLRENPQLRELFEKLEKLGIHSINDLKPKVHGDMSWGHTCDVCGEMFGNDYEKYEQHRRFCKAFKNIRDIMIETEVEWRFNAGVIPYMTFSNHAPYRGEFSIAIPKIIKELEKL